MKPGGCIGREVLNSTFSIQHSAFVLHQVSAVTGDKLMRKIAVAVTVMMLMVAHEATAQRVRASAPPAGTSNTVVVDPAQVVAALTPCMLVVNLTPAQRTQIQGILVAAQPVFEQLGNRIEADQAALDAAAGAASPDACAIGNAYLQRQTSFRALELQVRLVRNQIEPILTADQRARLEGCISAVTGLLPGGTRP
jgi:Spy/CpxP family protein refolding chaperone